MMKVLFLDRDGVINVENENGYILQVDKFQFYPGVSEAIQQLNAFFEKTIVVTNQRCVGKGLITHSDLHGIHQFMIDSLAQNDAHINDVFYAPALEDDDMDRKPNVGMGLKAKEKYPDIDFNASWMVGNNLSDMKFGKKLGMKTVFLCTTSDYNDISHSEWCDYKFLSLYDFAVFITAQKELI